MSPEEQERTARALVALAIRHNIVCDLDRARFETAAYSTAQKVSNGAGYESAIAGLRTISPTAERFRSDFMRLKFSSAEHSVARYLLSAFEDEIAATMELSIAGSGRVHVEHIYPQAPPQEQRWANHAEFVNRIGNLTLLDKRLNQEIKNSSFSTKKQQAYSASRLEIAKELLGYGDDWSPSLIETRQDRLCKLAEGIWPESLVP
jgi:hypothetical protein